MSVKQALKHYFAIRTEFYNKHKGVDLPIPQEPLEQSVYINFEKIEKELGFVIHTDIKDFLSSYWFDAIEGFLHDIQSKIYIDKTEMLNHLNSFLSTRERFVAVSHARRFGKSQAARMIDAYYSNKTDKGKTLYRTS